MYRDDAELPGYQQSEHELGLTPANSQRPTQRQNSCFVFTAVMMLLLPLSLHPPHTLSPPPFVASVLCLLLDSLPSAIRSVCSASRKPRRCRGPPPVYPTRRRRGSGMTKGGKPRSNAGVGSQATRAPHREGCICGTIPNTKRR